MATKKRWKVLRFYGVYTEKVVEAETEAQAIEIADYCVGTRPDQVMSTMDESTGYEIEEVGEDEDLTELTEDDKRWIDQYYEHLKKQQAQQETSLEADQG